MRGLEARELCVGIDPSNQDLDEWGLPATAEGAREFSELVLEAADKAGARVVKPQSAFFEARGSPGIRCLEDVLATARSLGLQVIMDAKRGDIGSTNEGYAACYFGEDAPQRVDALTVSPYLGVGALSALLDAAEAHSGTVFVLLATSNPEAQRLQGAVLEDGRTVADLVASEIADARDGRHPQTVGAVVGATIDPGRVRELAELLGEGAPVLMPGVGPQGGSVEAVAAADIAGGRPIVPVSRRIARRGPNIGAMVSEIDVLRSSLRSDSR